MERTSGEEYFNETIVSKRTPLWRSYAATKGCKRRETGLGVQLGQRRQQTTPSLMVLHTANTGGQAAMGGPRMPSSKHIKIRAHTLRNAPHTQTHMSAQNISKESATGTQNSHSLPHLY